MHELNVPFPFPLSLSWAMERRRPPMHLNLPDVTSNSPVEFTLGAEGMVIRRGIMRFEIAHDDVLTLVRWLLWHALYGWWKPRG